MAPTDPARRPSAGARRVGYCIAIAFSAALLFVLNGRPGWQAMAFLTSDAGQVLWLVSLSLAAGIAASAMYLAHDPPWLKALGDLATTGIGLAAAIRGLPNSLAMCPGPPSAWNEPRAVRCGVGSAGERVEGDERVALGAQPADHLRRVM